MAVETTSGAAALSNPISDANSVMVNSINLPALESMESETSQTPNHFENIFITTIKTDRVSVSWNGIQSENNEQSKEPKHGEDEKQRISVTGPCQDSTAVIFKKLPTIPEKCMELQTEGSDRVVADEKHESADKRKSGTPKNCTPFNFIDVLADMKFCVPKSGIEKKQNLDLCDKGQSVSVGNSKPRVFKIRKRLIQQRNAKAAIKKPWKKRGQQSKRLEDRVVEKKSGDSAELATSKPFPVIKAHTKWNSPEEMRVIFDKLCQVCYSYHEGSNSDGACPLMSPTTIVNHDPDSVLGYELPREIFLGYSRVYNDRLSLFARNFTPKLTQFGPLKGRKLNPSDLSKLCLPDIDLDHFWPVKRTVKAHDYLTVDEYIDTKDVSLSNWLRFLLPEHSSALFADDSSPLKANIQRVLKEDSIYFVTIRDIKMGEELFLRCLEPPERIYFNLAAMAASTSSSLNKTKVKVLLDDCTTCKGKLREKFPFPSILRMVRHRRMMHNTLPAMCDYANIFHCNFCGAEFRFQTELRKHRNEEHLIHDKQHNTQCQYCKIYKKSVDALSGHVSAVHFVNSDHPVSCTICGLQFPTHGKYQQHRVNDHRPEAGHGGGGGGAERGNTCSLCGKEFKTYSTLRKHVWKVHEKKDYRVCETCGKSFKDKYQLKVHTLTHSGIKPFQCDVDGCTAAFTTKQWLQKHYRSAHSFTDDNMPEIKRKIDFSDNVILTSQSSCNTRLEKLVNGQNENAAGIPAAQHDTSKRNFSNTLEQTPQTAGNNSSHFSIPLKPQPSHISMMNNNIDLSPNSSNLSNGTSLTEIPSHQSNFTNRDSVNMAPQNCLPVTHFAALSHGMAVQNALQAPRAPVAPPFNDQQVAHGGRWTPHHSHTVHNQQIPNSQGVFDSGYYSIHDFY